eukprot:6397166-Pyramimonas_sp.AAC.1
MVLTNAMGVVAAARAASGRAAARATLIGWRVETLANGAEKTKARLALASTAQAVLDQQVRGRGGESALRVLCDSSYGF